MGKIGLMIIGYWIYFWGHICITQKIDSDRQAASLHGSAFHPVKGWNCAQSGSHCGLVFGSWCCPRLWTTPCPFRAKIFKVKFDIIFLPFLSCAWQLVFYINESNLWCNELLVSGNIWVVHHIGGFLGISRKSCLKSPLLTANLLGNFLTIALHQILVGGVGVISSGRDALGLDSWLHDWRVQPITTTCEVFLIKALKDSGISVAKIDFG